MRRSKLRSTIISGTSQLAVRQAERGVVLVVEDPHPRQAAPDVAGGVVEAMVVVPLEGGTLGPAVLDQVIDVGLLGAGLDQQVVAGLAAAGSPCGIRQ